MFESSKEFRQYKTKQQEWLKLYFTRGNGDYRATSLMIQMSQGFFKMAKGKNESKESEVEEIKSKEVILKCLDMRSGCRGGRLF